MTAFKNRNLSAEEAFWVMYYFLEEHYSLSNGTFDVSDVLSASEPIADNNNIKVPIDSGMIDFWNDAIKKFETFGSPPIKNFGY